MAGGALQPARVRAVRLRHLRDLRRRRPDGGRLPRGRPRSPATSGSTTSAGSTTTTTSRSTATPRSPTRTTSPRRFDGLRLERDHGSATRTSFVELTRALDGFKATEDRPTLIIVDSHIGYGSPHKQDTAAAHGEPLGEEEVRETKRAYGWPEDAEFLVPDGVREHFAEGIGARGAELSAAWERAVRRLRARARARSSDRSRRCSGASCPRAGTRDDPVASTADAKGIATRKASNKVQNAIAAQRALAARRLGRPDRLDLGAPRRFDGAGDFQPGSRGRPPAPLRDPRARVGGDLERALALEAAPARGRPTSPSPTTRGPRSGSRR